MENDLRDSQPIAVLGAGASGRAIAALIARDGLNVQLLGREGPVDRIAVVIDKQQTTIDLYTGDKKQDLCLVTLPAYALTALEQRAHAHPAVSYVPLNNGFLGEKYWQSPYYPGINHIGSTYNRKTDVVEVFSKEPKLLLPNAVKHLVPGHSQNKLPRCFQFATDIRVKRAEKFFINLVLNTLSGAYDLSQNKEAKVQAEFSQVKEEALSLTDELYDLKNIGESSKTLALDRIKWALKQYGENTNSMVQALRRKKRTEADYLSGKANPERHPNLTRLHQIIVSKSEHP